MASSDTKHVVSHDFDATLNEKNRVEVLLSEWASCIALDKKIFDSMMLMLDELVTNVVVHGFEEVGESGRIHLTLETDGTLLRATLKDTARQFDPFSVPEADTTLSIEDRDIGGLGIHFVRQMTDNYEWKREGQFNVVVIEKKLA